MQRYIQTATCTAMILILSIVLVTRYGPVGAKQSQSQGAVTVGAMERTLAGLRDAIARDPDTVIVVGDSSLLQHFILKPEQTLGALLAASGALPGVRIRVVAYRGFGPVAYYLLADELAALHPRAVVLVANLQAFADRWFLNLDIKHPELAAFVSPARVIEALALPLEAAGITDSSLLLKPVLRQVGGEQSVAVLRTYRDRFRGWMDESLARLGSKGPREEVAGGVPRVGPPLPKRRGEAGVAWRRHFGRGGAGRGGRAGQNGAGKRRGRRKKARGWVTTQFQSGPFYPDRLTRHHAATRVMAAAIRRLAAGGCQVVVLLLPVHLQALRMNGEYRRRDIEGAISLIKGIAVENGGVPIDLTHLLARERYFQDAHTHFTAEGNKLVAARVLEELERVITVGQPGERKR